MKSKLKIRKRDNTTVVEYFKMKKPFEFRYSMMSKVLTSQGEAIMFINTNARTKKPEKRMEVYFDENKIEYELFKIPQAEKRILGLVINTFKKPKPQLLEKFIMAKINAETFTKELFDDCISTFDIALGFGSKLTFDEIRDDYRENIMSLFFNKEYFEEFMYDSIIFACSRSTIDIKEIGLECER